MGHVALTGEIIFLNTVVDVPLRICSLVGAPGLDPILPPPPPPPPPPIPPPPPVTGTTGGGVYNIENKLGRISRVLRAASVAIYLDSKRG